MQVRVERESITGRLVPDTAEQLTALQKKKKIRVQMYTCKLVGLN